MTFFSGFKQCQSKINVNYGAVCTEYGKNGLGI